MWRRCTDGIPTALKWSAVSPDSTEPPGTTHPVSGAKENKRDDPTRNRYPNASGLCHRSLGAGRSVKTAARRTVNCSLHCGCDGVRTRHGRLTLSTTAICADPARCNWGEDQRDLLRLRPVWNAPVRKQPPAEYAERPVYRYPSLHQWHVSRKRCRDGAEGGQRWASVNNKARSTRLATPSP